MSVSEYISFIEKEFNDGKKFIELPSSNPGKLRKRIYKACRSRGLLWGFATCENSVFVIATL